MILGLLPGGPSAAAPLAQDPAPASFRNTTDFDRDGVPDIVWRNYRSGENLVWYMSGSNGATYREFKSLPTVADLNWRLEAVDDFDDDDIPDLLWRNYASGENLIWYMDGAMGDTIREWESLPTVADLNWQPEATGDFDLDGVPDIVWRNYRSGENLIWYMTDQSGSTYREFKSLITVADTNWRIGAVTDYDRDDTPDIVWRNYASGENLIWQMSGVLGDTYRDHVTLTVVPDLNWQIIGAGDLNGDGASDLLWRNVASGENLAWYMASSAAALDLAADAVGPTYWELVAPSVAVAPDSGWGATAPGSNYKVAKRVRKPGEETLHMKISVQEKPLFSSPVSKTLAEPDVQLDFAETADGKILVTAFTKPYLRDLAWKTITAETTCSNGPKGSGSLENVAKCTTFLAFLKPKNWSFGLTGEVKIKESVFKPDIKITQDNQGFTFKYDFIIGLHKKPVGYYIQSVPTDDPSHKIHVVPAGFKDKSFDGTLVIGEGLVLGEVELEAVEEGPTELISVDSDEVQGNISSNAPAISDDGRYVAFGSYASNLVTGDTNFDSDIFVRDRQSGTTTRVSVVSGGAQADADSINPAISGDGRYVAFVSFATNLDPGGNNGFGIANVFVHDRQSGTTTRVSNTNRKMANSATPAISDDGRYVAFQSPDANLVAGDTNSTYDIFVYDRQSGTTSRVSVVSGGAQANDGSINPAISGDGRYVAFQSVASNLAPGDTNGWHDVFVHDRQSGTTTLISGAAGGAQANSESRTPAISKDGRYVAFQSYASNLVAGDTNGTYDIFVHDRQSAVITRISDGEKITDAAFTPEISDDGRYVTLEASGDIFVHDRQSGTTTLVSVAVDGGQSNNASLEGPAISGDGCSVAFTSYASNLVANDTNASYDTDVFARRLCNPTAPAP
jgi:hypothetical protein